MAAPDINLIPSASNEKAPGGVKDQIFEWVLNNGKKIVLITQAIVLLVFISRFKFDSDIRKLNKEIEQNQVVVENYAELEEKYLENQRRLGLIKPIIEDQIDWAERLQNFNTKIPNNLTLKNLQFEESKVKISAKTNSAQAFQLFVSLLVDDSSVQSAVLEASEFNTETNEYEFVISIEVKNE